MDSRVIKCVAGAGKTTEGNFEVTKVFTTLEKVDILKIAAHIESFSNHPIAKSITASYLKEIDKKKVSNFKEVSGKGVIAKYDGVTYYLGNSLLMSLQNIDMPVVKSTGTVIHIATDNKYLGYLIISDVIKKHAKREIANLKKLGIKRILLLSGDDEKVVEGVSKKVGIDEYYASLLPQDKVKKVEELTLDNKVMFVGDGMI